MRTWLAPWSVATLALSCSLANDLSELEGSPDASASGGVGGAGGASGGAGSGAQGGSTALCQAACDRQLAAQCSADDMASCLSFCETAGQGVAPKCRPAWESLMACVGSQGSFSCDATNKAVLDNCVAQTDALTSCLATGSGGSAGSGGAGGSVGGSGGAGGSAQCQTTLLNKTCNDFQQNVCTDCLVANCCAEANGCFAEVECAGLYECYSACSTSADPLACVDQQCPACKPGVDRFNLLGQCLTDNCSLECGTTS